MPGGSLGSISLESTSATTARPNSFATIYDFAEGRTSTVYQNYSLDIASLLGTDTAHAGFTGRTGASWENQDILNWKLDNAARLKSLPGLGLRARRRSSTLEAAADASVQSLPLRVLLP